MKFLVYLLEIFELLVLRQSLFLSHAPVNADGGKVLLGQQLGQRYATLNTLHEDDDLTNSKF